MKHFLATLAMCLVAVTIGAILARVAGSLFPLTSGWFAAGIIHGVREWGR